MFYPEYKEASLRHLNTVEFVVNSLNTAKDANEERNLLRNAYYLAGYTIECIVTYAIYNHIGYSKTIDVRSLEPWTYRFNVGFYKICRNPANLRQTRRPRFTISSHRFQNNCTFFSLQGIAGVNKIPHFDSFIPDPTMVPLFNSWRPEVRYVDCGFTKNEIIGFVKLSKDIHLKTRQFITKD